MMQMAPLGLTIAQMKLITELKCTKAVIDDRNHRLWQSGNER
jgi:hypothetical protein